MENSTNYYNVQIISVRLDNVTFKFVTVRQDQRDEDAVWSSRNDGDAPVYQALRQAGRSNISVENPPHLQQVTQAQGKRAQSVILAGFDMAYGEHRVLNVKTPKLKVA